MIVCIGCFASLRFCACRGVRCENTMRSSITETACEVHLFIATVVVVVVVVVTIVMLLFSLAFRLDRCWCFYYLSLQPFCAFSFLSFLSVPALVVAVAKRKGKEREKRGKKGCKRRPVIRALSPEKRRNAMNY